MLKYRITLEHHIDDCLENASNRKKILSKNDDSYIITGRQYFWKNANTETGSQQTIFNFL